jgi:hypothetical protein
MQADNAGPQILGLERRAPPKTVEQKKIASPPASPPLHPILLLRSFHTPPAGGSWKQHKVPLLLYFTLLFLHLDDFSFDAQGFPSLSVRGSLVHQKKRHLTPLWKVLYEVHKNPMTFLFLNVDIFNIYIQKRKGTEPSFGKSWTRCIRIR